MQTRILTHTSRPFLIVGVIRDDSHELRRLLAILIAISYFVWLHRFAFLELIENVNRLFVWIAVMVAVWHELPNVVFGFMKFGYGPG